MLRDALRFWSLAGERGEDAVENAEPAPAYEAVVERLVRPITPGRVFPLQTVANHIDDTADDAPVVDARHTVSQRKMRRNPRHLVRAQQKQIIHQSPPNRKDFESHLKQI